MLLANESSAARKLKRYSEKRRRESSTDDERSAGNTAGAATDRQNAVKDRLLSFLVTITIVVSLAFLITARYAYIAELGYQLTNLEEQAQQLNDEAEYLRFKLARLKSPERITRLAREELGMRESDKLEGVPRVAVDTDGEFSVTAKKMVVTMEAKNEHYRSRANWSLAEIGMKLFKWLTGISSAEARSFR